MPRDPLSEITDRIGGPTAKVRRIAEEEGLDPELADDFLNVTGGIESGNRHYARKGKVLRSPAGAWGFAQVMPDVKGGTTRTIGKRKFNLLDEDDNIRAGLNYFAEGGSDPVARRIGYLSGHHSKAVRHYKATGKIPKGGDPYTGVSFAQYVAASKGQKLDPLSELTRDPLTTATADDPLSELTAPAAPQPTKPAKKRKLSEIAKSGAKGVRDIATGIGTASPPPPGLGAGELRRTIGREQRGVGMIVGELRRRDDATAAQVVRIQQEIAAQQTPAEKAARIAPGSADRSLMQGHLNEDEEVVRRLQSEQKSAEAQREAETRRKELIASLTPEDVHQMQLAAQRMRGQGEISRGIETGSQRIGSGLLYKIAGLLDIEGKLPASAGFFIPVAQRKQLANYLRRQAGRGELSIEEIQAEIPPSQREQAAEFITQALGALPEIYLATATGGTVGGFAALAGMEAAGRGEGPGKILAETAKGAALGKVFEGARAFERPITPGMNKLGQRLANIARSTPPVAAGTVGVEAVSGADPQDAATSAAANVLFHVGGRLAGEAGPIRENLRHRNTRRQLLAQGQEVLTPPGVKPKVRIPAIAREVPPPITETAPGEVATEVPTGPKISARKPDTDPLTNILSNVVQDIKGRVAKSAPKPKPAPSPNVTPAAESTQRSRMVDRWADKLREGGAPTSAVDAVVNSFRAGKQTREEAISTLKLLAEEKGIGKPAPDESTLQPRRQRNVATGRKGQFKKKGQKGFLNVTEINNALTELSERVPTTNRRELRGRLMEERPELFKYATTREKADWLAGMITGPANAPGIWQEPRVIIEREDFPDIDTRAPRSEMQTRIAEQAREFARERVSETRGSGAREVLEADPGDVRMVEETLAKQDMERARELMRINPKLSMSEAVKEVDRENRFETALDKLKNYKLPPEVEAKREAALRKLFSKEGDITDLTERDIDAGPRGTKRLSDLSDGELQKMWNQLYNVGVEFPKNKAEQSINREINRQADAINEELRRRGKSPIDKDVEKILKLLKKGKKGEAGYINIGEIRSAVSKVFEEEAPNGKVVGYDFKGKDGKTLRIVLGIDSEGIAHPFIGPPRGEQGIDMSNIIWGGKSMRKKQRMNLGTDVVLGIKHYIQEQHPEIKRIDFSRSGSTGGAEGRFRELAVTPRTGRKGEEGFINPRELVEGAQELYDQFSARHGTEAREAESIIRGSLRPGSSISRQGGRDYEGYSIVLEFGDKAKGTAYSSPYGPTMHKGAETTRRALKDIKRVMFDAESYHSREDAIADYARIRKALDETGRKNVPIEGVKYDDNTERYTYGGKVDFKSVSTYAENVAKINTQRNLDREVNEAMDSYMDALEKNDTSRISKWEKRLELLEARGKQLEAELAKAEKLKKFIAPKEGGVAEEVERGGKISVRRKSEAGFLNVSEIESALADLRARMPNANEAELRKMVEKSASPAAWAAYELQHIRRLSSKGGSTLGTTTTEARVSDEWKDVLKQIKDRMKETGGLTVGGNIYDVTKYPKGGKPDIEKISYWIEPAVEKLWVEANKQAGKGKLKAQSLRDYVKTEFDKLIDTEFSDWHVVNRKAAHAVVARRLSQIAGPTPKEAAKSKKSIEGQRKEWQKNVNLWKSYDSMPDAQLHALAQKKFPEAYRTSPEAAMDRLFRQILPNVKKKTADTWHEEVMNRLNAQELILDKEAAKLAAHEPSPAEQATALKGSQTPTSFHEPKPPRTDAGESELAPGEKVRRLWERLATTHREAGTEAGYNPEKMADWDERAHKLVKDFGTDAALDWYSKAPDSAVKVRVGRILGDHLAIKAAAGDEAALAQAVSLANDRVLRSTEAGREVKAHDDPEYKLSLEGALEEATRLYRQSVGDATARLPAPIAAKVNKAAVARDKAKKKVAKLEAKVASEPDIPPAEVAKRAIRIIKKNAGKPSASPPETLGMGLGGIQMRFEVPPSVRQAQKQKSQAAKTFRMMQRRVGRYWTKASHPHLEVARIELRRRTRELATQLEALRANDQGFMRRLGNTTRSLMVSAFPSASRNAQTQVGRSGMERLTDAAELTLRWSLGLQSDVTGRDIAKNYLRQFKASRGFATEILSEFPDELSRIFATYAGGVNIPQPNVLAKGVKRIWDGVDNFAYHMNFFNRAQEFHVRSAEFLADLEIHTRKATGMTLEQFIARYGPEKLPPALIKRAVNRALEVTFAANPPRNTKMGQKLNWLIEFGNALPPTASPVPFPRYMYDSLKFLYQYNPIGGAANIAHAGLTNRAVSKRVGALRARTDLTIKERDAAIRQLLDNRRNVPRAIAQQMLGTAMLTLAYQVRNNKDLAGEKWYELKTKLGTFDTRPFGPFSTYLLMAEAIRRKRAGERDFTLKEWLGGLGASSPAGGISISAAERIYGYYENGDYEKMGDLLAREAGEVVRAAFTPVRQIKDIISQFDESQRITRDTKDRPILGPLAESLPYVSEKLGLPEAHRYTSGRPVQQENPLGKFITGHREISPKNFIEQELDRLKFRPQEIRRYTGIPKLDNAINRHAGPILDAKSAELRTDPEYVLASDAEKFAIMREALQSAYQAGMDAAAEELPDEYSKYKSKKPYWKRKLEEEAAAPSP